MVYGHVGDINKIKHNVRTSDDKIWRWTIKTIKTDCRLRPSASRLFRWTRVVDVQLLQVTAHTYSSILVTSEIVTNRGILYYTTWKTCNQQIILNSYDFTSRRGLCRHSNSYPQTLGVGGLNTPRPSPWLCLWTIM